MMDRNLDMSDGWRKEKQYVTIQKIFNTTAWLESISDETELLWEWTYTSQTFLDTKMFLAELNTSVTIPLLPTLMTLPFTSSEKPEIRNISLSLVFTYIQLTQVPWILILRYFLHFQLFYQFLLLK